jgi:uncharacterized protein (TIGR02145 family)
MAFSTDRPQLKILLSMRSKLFFLTLALVMTSAASVNAQVLIGANEANMPHAGAILELSPIAGTNLGLLLPNVALNSNESEFALGSSVNEDLTTATGMIVYNTADVLSGPGLYVWDGNKWDVVICFPATPERITFSTTITKLGETITASVPEVTGATSYIWTLPDGLTATGASSTREITIDASAAGEYPAGSIKVKAVTACGTTAEQSNTTSIIVCRTAMQDLEDNWYCTGDFGTAGVWMTQNLRYRGNLTHFTDYLYLGETAMSSNPAIFESYPEYGLLYTNDRNLDICPEGWHLPTEAEWTELSTVLKDPSRIYSIGSSTSAGINATSQTLYNESTLGASIACWEGGFDSKPTGWYTTWRDFRNEGERVIYRTGEKQIGSGKNSWYLAIVSTILPDHFDISTNNNASVTSMYRCKMNN